jgi:hypothetical protein
MPVDKIKEDRKEHGPHGGPGSKPEGIPPHILKEIFDLKEKVGRLEGMLEVLLKKM